MLSWHWQAHIFVMVEELTVSLMTPLHAPCSLFMQSSDLDTQDTSMKLYLC